MMDERNMFFRSHSIWRSLQEDFGLSRALLFYMSHETRKLSPETKKMSPEAQENNPCAWKMTPSAGEIAES